MNYVISNLYGNYDNYEAILKKINFNKNDTLFVLGNIVDGGNKGIEILQDMMLRENVFPILGDHDYIAYEVLSQIYDATKDDITAPLSKEVSDLCQMWIERGGEGTLEGFAKLSNEEKEAVLDYLEEFSLYEEVEAGDMEFVLSYSVPDDFFIDDKLEDYSAEEILSGEIDYERDCFFGKVLVSAKDFVDDIVPGPDGTIFKNECHIAINCGDITAAYCLDTDEEFYI